ncbi:MAG: 3,4-dehydroadipyl-CoA semialdehyde dehydrogenase [Myxococcaceae bacterium]|nr:3,4-dehydroadipyl-CoA semialdehyde dehydrogenase [Myxococcaceae bacterium]
MTTTLTSYLSGKWVAGQGNKTALYNPATEEVVAEASTGGVDFAAAVSYARTEGVKSLHGLTFAGRAEVLKRAAQVINDHREDLIKLGIINAGNTRSDAKFDIDGAAATLNFYAELAAKLGETRVLADGDGTALGRSARLYGQHVWTPRAGVAVHINAFNFPAWGMAEKLAVAIAAGMPVITKPATSTALMAHRIAELWVEAKVFPAGAFSFVCGNVGDLLNHLSGQDVLAFTGSGDTAATLRKTESLVRHNVHVNVEADSLNSALLGPDATEGTETLNMFLTDVAKEISQKTGQKCTAVRRIYVPAAQLNSIRDALVERLKEVRVGNPAEDKVTMGPLATANQLRDIRAGIDRLAKVAEVALGGSKPVEGHAKGYFVTPTLFVHRQPKADASDVVNAHEVFGPVATLMPYSNNAELVALVSAGGGGLVSSVYSDDKAFLAEVVGGIAPFHGRVTISGEKVAGQTISPGMALPGLLHGGPGRAGGGEELGGARGMSLYMQRVALQGPRPWVEQFAGVKPASAPAAT